MQSFGAISAAVQAESLTGAVSLIARLVFSVSKPVIFWPIKTLLTSEQQIIRFVASIHWARRVPREVNKCC